MIRLKPLLLYLAVIFILILGLLLRLVGPKWDQGYHLHPDERFLTMVTNDLVWPKTFSEYLNTQKSTLNPHNRGHGFFVYGTFPIFFTKMVSTGLSMDDYDNLIVVGRIISAFFDAGTILLVFLIAKNMVNSKKDKSWQIYFPVMAMFFYALLVLPIQLSHFYAVETFLTFFLTLSFYLLIKLINFPSKKTDLFRSIRGSIMIGITFGLAVASKISAVTFVPIIALSLFIWLLKTKDWLRLTLVGFSILLFGYFTVRLAQPYLFDSNQLITFKINQKVLANWKELQSFNQPDTGFPPGIQWISTKPYLFPLTNLIFWGTGLPQGILILIGIAVITVELFNFFLRNLRSPKLIIENSEKINLTLVLAWIFLLFAYQGIQFSKNMRYFHPLYPFLALISSYFIVNLFAKFRKKTQVFYILSLVMLVYPLSFISIYSIKNSRVQASQWIYHNIASNSNLGVEHWDDGLPLPIPDTLKTFNWTEFPLYGQDNQEKWTDMDDKLKKVDYIILSSNRLYGSITSVPEKFPITYHYYQLLFSGKLGFRKIAEFTSRPTFPLPFLKLCITNPLDKYGKIIYPYQECNENGIAFVDDYADESFTVYDHPKVTIFKKIREKDYFDLIYNKKI